MLDRAPGGGGGRRGLDVAVREGCSPRPTPCWPWMGSSFCAGGEQGLVDLFDRK